METIRLRSWDRFDEALKRVYRKYGRYRRQLESGDIYEKTVRILFRGQADATWKLQTTLERKTNADFDVSKYLLYASHAVNEIESFTGAKWNVPDWPEVEREIEEKSDPFRVPMPMYDFLVYLRHHGYASPLLDWTESPYIAAYFAYLTSQEKNPAVYCYIETPELGKGGVGGQPMITVKGPYVSTHKRHFAQKAWYTIATCWTYQQKKHVFCSHQEVFSRGSEGQDVLVKIVLPALDRKKALKKLNDYNINHFTLFQSEDALVKALESKHFDLDGI